MRSPLFANDTLIPKS